jgi:YHS domain-containing protein
MRANRFLVRLGIGLFSVTVMVSCGKGRETADKDDQSGPDLAAPAEKAPPVATPTPEASNTPIKNGFDGMPAPGTEAVCPVMKHPFKVTADSPYSVYKGKTYVFCCPGCKPTFDADPATYIANLNS